jgi:hypothetical protein
VTRSVQPVRRAAWLVPFVFCCLLGGLLIPGTAQAVETVGTAPVINNSPPSAPVNTSYWFEFDTTGSDPVPQFSQVSGTLPAGLSLAANGIIWGFPTAMGPGTPVTVRASNGVADTDITFTIDVVASPPTFTSTTVPATGTVGVEYYGRLYLRGTPTPVTSVTSGDLPPGVRFENAYSELIGTPTTPGTYTFTVTATNGAQPDASVTLTITVAPADLPATGTPGTAAPLVAIADAGAREGDRGQLTPMTFRVTLSAPAATPVTVRWATHDGTAVAGRDYVAASGTVTFAPGQTVATVTVQVRGDRQHERTECFTVRLSSPVGTTLGDGSGVGRIYDND